MKRLMIVARLRPDAHDEAEALLRAGPPFDPAELGFERHAAYLSAGEVVFTFEASEVEWIVNDLVDDPRVASFFTPWAKLIETTPRLAHERFYWSREEEKLGVGLGV
ncbi:MAG: hypothetical protein ACJ74M_02120 [Gaiellaceae bacterium]